MIMIVPLLIIFLTIWGFNTFYFDPPQKNDKKIEKNITQKSMQPKEYFKKYIEK